jgi:carbonic anhydrase
MLYLQGPMNWAALADANSACSTGTNQSPINMIDGQFTLVEGSDLTLEIPDQPEGVEFENLGTTVEAIMEGKGGKLTRDGKEFELKQFHVHHPSEHTDNGVSVASTFSIPLKPPQTLYLET